MKELERTNRISISAVLFLLVILIGFLTFKKPQFIFEKSPAATINKMASRDYILTQNKFKAMDPTKYTVVDIRSNFDFEKGHLKNAVNISTNDAFSDNSIAFLNQQKDKGKTIVLYGNQPDSANSAWMLLYQMGYDNVKILCISTDFVDNQFQTYGVALEKPMVNFADVMKSSQGDKTKSIKTKAPKKVIPMPKKKKRVAEGGC